MVLLFEGALFLGARDWLT